MAFRQLGMALAPSQRMRRAGGSRIGIIGVLTLAALACAGEVTDQPLSPLDRQDDKADGVARPLPSAAYLIDSEGHAMGCTAILVAETAVATSHRCAARQPSHVVFGDFAWAGVERADAVAEITEVDSIAAFKLDPSDPEEIAAKEDRGMALLILAEPVSVAPIALHRGDGPDLGARVYVVSYAQDELRYTTGAVSTKYSPRNEPFYLATEEPIASSYAEGLWLIYANDRFELVGISQRDAARATLVTAGRLGL